MHTQDFLLEIGCEELPAKGLFPLAELLSNALSKSVKKYLGLLISPENIKIFATPRRLAILIKDLLPTGISDDLTKRGPALNAPETAKMGFAKSCGVDLENLKVEGNYYYYIKKEEIPDTEKLLPALVNHALSQLTGIKTMHWGNQAVVFLRPVHWVLMLYGEKKIDAEILGVKTSSDTYGHRFHYPSKINLSNAADYEEVLSEEGFVQADFEKRREFIRSELQQTAATLSARMLIDETLLEEVTGLVEWPVVLLCRFSPDFLSVPEEALISSMQHHQKCFPLYDSHENLMPYFMTVSNIQSENPQLVIKGNERVMHARLSDAAFFYEQDKKTSLLTHVKSLQTVIFQQKLGTMADKVIRLTALSEKMAAFLHADKNHAKKASLLCKADLMTHMVNEFPELQGIMGEYYARLQGESSEIGQAIREHYLPRFAGDKLPKSAIGCVVALSDRFDTLNSIFKAGQAPSGDKDPFGLRRAALGIIRIIIEKELKQVTLDAFCEIPEVHIFILERLPAYYQEAQIPSDTLQAVLEVERNNLYDIHLRILALQNFRILPEACALSEGNKRLRNILKKNKITENSVDTHLFKLEAEKNLYTKIQHFPDEKNYEKMLAHLAGLREAIDQFFTDVMVEVADTKLKQNRLLLLKTLREIFLKIADISLLQLK